MTKGHTLENPSSQIVSDPCIPNKVGQSPNCIYYWVSGIIMPNVESMLVVRMNMKRHWLFLIYTPDFGRGSGCSHTEATGSEFANGRRSSHTIK
jgi:hypothetical protein